MKYERKIVKSFIAIAMGVILLLSSCFAFATFYKCSSRGTISLFKKSFESYKCCCCKEESQNIVQKDQTSIQCCHAVTLETNDYTNLGNDLSLINSAVVESYVQVFTFITAIKSNFPRRSAKLFSGVSPPIYLLKQSFLI